MGEQVWVALAIFHEIDRWKFLRGGTDYNLSLTRYAILAQRAADAEAVIAVQHADHLRTTSSLEQAACNAATPVLPSTNNALEQHASIEMRVADANAEVVFRSLRSTRIRAWTYKKRGYLKLTIMVYGCSGGCAAGPGKSYSL